MVILAVIGQAGHAHVERYRLVREQQLVAQVDAVLQAGQRPRHVTTALFGMDSSRVLGTAHDAADSWDQVADLIHRHVTSLKDACDQERASRGLPPLRMLGVGVEAGAPVYNGQVMPLSRDRSSHPVPLADKLHRPFRC